MKGLPFHVAETPCYRKAALAFCLSMALLRASWIGWSSGARSLMVVLLWLSDRD
jgi:hypothetical protein